MANNPAKMQMFQMFAQDQQENVFKQGSAYEKMEIGISYRLHRAFNFQISGECLLRLLHDNNKQPKHRLSISGERQTR